MPFINRYSNTIKGALTFTGNTLGLSKLSNSNLAGTIASIGAFTSLNTSLQVGDFPAGTTLNILENGSNAQLVIPIGSTIVYAELIWGGNYYGQDLSTGSIVDISSQINNPIKFTTPLGSNTINYSPITAQEPIFTNVIVGAPFPTAFGFYVRSQDVTNLVAAAGAGTYSVEQVPGLVTANDNQTSQTNNAGWTLAVAYRNSSLPYRNLNIYVGAQIVDRVQTPIVDIPISGFSTPASGIVNARLLVSAQEGDASGTGDQLLFGPNAVSLTAVSGPNNPVSNFFSSQINNDSGNLDTTGTFGNRNQNAFAGTNIIAGRQGWDITNINASSEMQNNQSSAILRFTTVPTAGNTGESYMPNTIGIQIDSVHPIVSINKSVDKIFIDKNGLVNYTLTITNTGQIGANNVIVKDDVPSGASINIASIAVDGASGLVINNSTNIEIDIDIGTLEVNQIVTITYAVESNSSTITPMLNTATADYIFMPVATGSIVTDSITSNLVQTQINYADLTSNNNFVKSVNKVYSDVGDIITYTLSITNTGTTNANNVIIVDSIPSGTSFVSSSITSTTPYTGIDISTGLTLVNPIQPLQIVVISYQVKVDTIPNPNPIPNTADINYDYKIDPNSTVSISKSGNSNTVYTQINNANLISSGNFIKSVDRQYATIGDIVTYTLAISNSGNIDANNVIITDNIPNGTSFVNGSIVCSVGYTGGIDTGLTLVNAIQPLQSVTLSYKIKIDQQPNPNPIPNKADIAYKYKVNPNSINEIATSGSSNTVNTLVNTGNISSSKNVDKVYSDIGDILTYTIIINNIGTVPVNNVELVDSIANGTSYVVGSINSTVSITGDPTTSISFINPIPINQIISITYKVKVDTIPNINPIPNKGNIKYTYTIDPNVPDGESGALDTNTVYTAVNHADLISNNNFIKSVDKLYVDIGDIIKYTISVTNTGNTSANNVVLTDIIPSGTNYVSGSLNVNASYSVMNPLNTITLLNPIDPNENITISFDVLVNSIPSPNPIPNIGNIVYNYTVDPNYPNEKQESGTTNTVYTQANYTEIDAKKSVDKDYADVGDILTYTIEFTNNSNVNIDNIVIYDYIQPDMDYIANSIQANVQFIGNPESTITLLNSLSVGGKVTMSYQVKINSIPNPNPIPNIATIDYTYTVDPSKPNSENSTIDTNTVNTQVNNAELSPIVKSEDKQYVNVGEEILYTITFTNSGNVAANNVVITDIIPQGTSLAVSSVTANVPFTQSLPELTVLLTNPVEPLENIVITFKVLVDEIPTINPIPNTSKIDYSYIVDPNNTQVVAQDISNTVLAQVNSAQITTPVKTVDKAYADVGDEITYTITFTNSGNVDANNVIISDAIPQGTSLVQNSITSSVAFTIGTPDLTIILTNPVAPLEVVTISFKVVVD